MKQYKVTYTVDTGEEDCFISPDDPIHKIKEEMFLGKLTNVEVEETIGDNNESI